MEFGERETVSSEGDCNLLKIIGCRGGKIAYCVLGGGGSTEHFDDYEDALDEFNLHWMKEKFGE